MPVSEMKFIGVKSEGTHYRLLCFKFGGTDVEELENAGFVTFDFIAGILLGPNYALFMDRCYGSGYFAVEKAGYFNGDLVAGWDYILKHFEDIENHAILMLERNAKGGWNVEKVETELIERR